MIDIRIGTSSRDIDSIDESWIAEQINRRRTANEEVCIEIVFNTENLKMGLSSPKCSRGGGRGRPPNEQEQNIIDLWNKNHLNTNDFTGGNLIAFIKQLKKLI